MRQHENLLVGNCKKLEKLAQKYKKRELYSTRKSQKYQYNNSETLESQNSCEL